MYSISRSFVAFLMLIVCFLLFLNHLITDQGELAFQPTTRTTQKAIESFTMSPAGSFCDYYQSNPDALNTEAGTLTKDNCMQTGCTVWLPDQSKCVAGNSQGPTFHTNQGIDVNKDTYYYQGKCYGVCR